MLYVYYIKLNVSSDKSRITEATSHVIIYRSNTDVISLAD